MMNKSEIFQAFWHGRPLPLLQWACLKSFIQKGHRVHLYAYDDIDAPSGVVRLAADDVIPRSKIFYFDNDNNGIPKDISPFSDLFRFQLLLDKGGWYIDTDVICNASEFPACEFAWAQELPELAPEKIGTSQIKFPAGNSIIERLFQECNQIKETFTVREQLGPHLISRVLSEYATPPSHVGSADIFYPLRWIETYKLWLPSYCDEITAKCRDTLFINCFNSIFSYMKLTIAGLPPRGSFLMDLYEKECPERIKGHILSELEVLKLAQTFFKNKQWAIQELLAVAGTDALKRINV